MSRRPAPEGSESGAVADIHAGRLLILDFGSQYTQLIARRVREIGVYCEIRPWRTRIEEIQAFAPRALILSGGPDTLTAGNSMRLPGEVLALDIPILGICYGMQLLAVHCGGEVETAGRREYGRARAQLTAPCPLFDGLAADPGNLSLEVWMSHGDRVTALPEGWEICAATDNAPIAAMQNPHRRWYGLQFHPEVTHTPAGAEILRRFVCEIAALPRLWTSGKIIEDLIVRVRAQVGGDRVLLALSGGVDSCVTAALLQRAIGGQLLCIFVDNGLLRLNEGDQMMRVLREQLQTDIVRVNAGARFFAGLRGVADPERKRRIIGETFIGVFEEEARRHGAIRWLAQGTIYPDVIESAAGGDAQTIKSHHNVGGLPQRMNLQLVEPLRELFKDEVRAIGAELGLPETILQRHPFPGPGLGVRILGEVSEEAAEVLRHADAIFIEELQRSGWYQKTSQAFAVYLPVHSVGVVGDARKYAPVIGLRAVRTDDFMTAHHVPLPAELLATVTRRILNEVHGVSRVVCDLSDKPPATIEWE